MKDISIYFQSVATEEVFKEETLGNYIHIYKDDQFPVIEKKGIAIIYVPEYRKDQTATKKKLHNDFRTALYSLYVGQNWKHAIYDLGTILPGNSEKDTYYALKNVCSELIKNEVIPVVIGGSQELSIPIYEAYKELEQLINLTTIDSQFDIENIEKEMHHKNWVGQILYNDLSYLFNFTNIGTQAHYTPKSQFHLFEELFFDVVRLGDIQQDISIAEPYLRNTDLLSVDLTALRASEFQNENYTAPNGLFAHETCRLLRYAGISDKLTCLGIFNYYGNNKNTTNEVVAQLIWYFMEGYSNRKNDFPIGSLKSYTKFRVFLEELNEEIIFLKSDKSERWWIEVQYPSGTNNKYIRHLMVPCSYNTYLETMKGNIPDLWWKTYQKMT